MDLKNKWDRQSQRLDELERTTNNRYTEFTNLRSECTGYFEQVNTEKAYKEINDKGRGIVKDLEERLMNEVTNVKSQLSCLKWTIVQMVLLTIVVIAANHPRPLK